MTRGFGSSDVTRNRIVKQVLGAGQLLQGNADFISGVKSQIKAKHRFDADDRAGQIMARLTRLKNGLIAIEKAEGAT